MSCTRCDDHDVEHPRTLWYAARDLHRAWHDLYRPIERATITPKETP